LLLAFTGSLAVAQEAPTPKFGPDAVPIFQSNEYLRQAPAPDYWTLSAFYVPQQTTSDCSAAALVMAVNALRGLPANADQEIVTEQNLLSTVGDKAWMDKVTQDGVGVTFNETGTYFRESLDAFDLKDVTVVTVQPIAADAAALAALRKALADNEASPNDVILIYFNQGVITGDWDGPHISAIGAYDVANDRVLIMDVDRNWYVPYWTSTETLLAALVKPIAEEHGPLAGGTGGYLLATKN
jgi:predicted secreted protein